MWRYVITILLLGGALNNICFAALPSAAIDSEPVVGSSTTTSSDTAVKSAAESGGQQGQTDGMVVSNGSDMDKKDAQIFKKIEKANETDKKRFFLIAKDERFFYYLDRKSARWILEPNSKQKIIDVWVKLVDANKADIPSGTYASDNDNQTYLLDHYYIRLKQRQIQFLCELEVMGQPSNNVKQNVYSVKNWEDIIPGSVEETIFNGVVNTKDNLVGIDVKKDGIDKKASDFLDRVLNVSI
ncbi:hypothetical protein [Pectinatus frisingensis]|uniref:hypothetical protein n=1 Tax=Pectinatus frisingensis TaxID=865 RepID=UPI0018C53EA3|nr:hypothetical protein [Pectinatus frisingensis]